MARLYAIGKSKTGKTVYSANKPSAPKPSQFKSHRDYSKASYLYSKSKRADTIAKVKAGKSLSSSELKGAGVQSTKSGGYKYYDSATQKYVTTEAPKVETKVAPTAEKKWYYDPMLKITTTRKIEGQDAMTKQEVFNVMRNLPRETKVKYATQYKSELARKKEVIPTTPKSTFGPRISNLPSTEKSSPPISTKDYYDYISSVKQFKKSDDKPTVGIKYDVSKVEPYQDTKVTWENLRQTEKAMAGSNLLLQHLSTADQTIPKKQQRDFQKYMHVKQNIQAHFDKEWAKIVGIVALTAVGMGYAGKAIPALGASKVPGISFLSKVVSKPIVSTGLKYSWYGSLGYRGVKQADYIRKGEWERGAFGLGRLGGEYLGVKIGVSGKLKLPEIKGIKLASYKGFGYEYGSYGKPLVGKADGKILFGDKPIKLNIKEPFRVEGASATKILQKSLKPVMSSTELKKFNLLLKYTKKFETTPSKYVVSEFIKQTKVMTPKEIEVILKVTAKNKGTIFGSFAQYQSTKPNLRILGADVDIRIAKSQVEALKFAQEMEKSLKGIGSKVRLKPSGTLIEKYIPSTTIKGKLIKGRWVHGVDINLKEIQPGKEFYKAYNDLILKSDMVLSEKSYGFQRWQPTIKIKSGGTKIETQRLSEQLVRKFESLAIVRPSKTGKWTIAPEEWRTKDIPGYFSILETHGEKALDLRSFYDPKFFKDLVGAPKVLLYKPPIPTKTIYPIQISSKVVYPTKVTSYKIYPLTKTTPTTYSMYTSKPTTYPVLYPQSRYSSKPTTYPVLYPQSRYSSKPTTYPTSYSQTKYPSKPTTYPVYPSKSPTYPVYPSKPTTYPVYPSKSPTYPVYPSKPTTYPVYPSKSPTYPVYPTHYTPSPPRYIPRPPTYPPPPPIFKFPKSKVRPQGKKKEKKKRSWFFGYSPSLIAGMDRITSYKIPKRITGLGIRPVVRKRKNK